MTSQDDQWLEFVNCIDSDLSRLLSQALDGNNPDAFWALLCDQIERADLKGKQICVRLAELLLDGDQWPGVWTFYLIDLLFALYELITEKAFEDIPDLKLLGANVASLMSAIGSILQGEYARILRTPFVDATPSKLLQWFLRCTRVIVHENFVKLSSGLLIGILEYFRGVMLMFTFFDDEYVRELGSDLAESITKCCCSPFFRSGDRRQISELLRLFCVLGGKLAPAVEGNADFYSRLHGLMKSGPSDAIALVTLLGDAVPFDDDDISKLPAVLLTTFANTYGIVFRQYYGEFASRIVKRLIGRLMRFVDMSSEDVADKIDSYFERSASLFGYVRQDGSGIDLEYWLTKSIKHILPILMLSPSSTSSAIHETLSKLSHTTRHNLISENVRHILVKLALKDFDHDEMTTIYDFIEKEGIAMKDGQENRYSFNQYVAMDLFQCVYELLMHLAASKDRIIDVLAQICQEFGDNQVQSPHFALDKVKNVVGFVRPRLLGVLSRFTGKFAGRDPFDEKLLALRSLTSLIELNAGEVLSEVSSKMMSTLRAAAAIDDRRLRPQVANAWKVFIANVTSTTMKEVALPVFVAITPYLSMNNDFEDPPILESLLSFIFVDQMHNLQDQIADIAFLSVVIDSPLLRNYCPPFDDSKHSLKELLRTGLRLLQNEHPDAKRLSLERLKVLLRRRSNEIYKLMLNSVSVDDIICRLMDTLIAAVQHSDINVRRSAAVCIGHLGSIDPGRLRICPTSMAAQQRDVAFADFDLEQSHEFPVILLGEVTRLLLASSTEWFYDICSCTLQAILRYYKCREGTDKKNTLAYSIWNKLDESTRKILTPFLTSNYKLGERNVDTDQLPHPLFGSSSGSNFKQWLTTWITSLIIQVAHPSAKELFMILKVVARSDVGFAQFLLPYVVLQRIREGSEEDGTKIKEELMAAMTGVGENGSISNDVQFERCSAHVVFCVLDFLYKWTLKTQESTLRAIGYASVEAFITSIPKKRAAGRAIAFDAFPRALMYYEKHMDGNQNELWTHMRRLTTTSPVGGEPKDLCAHMRHLQEIYAKLDDVDSVVGALVVLKKACQRVGKEQMLALEAAGNYAEALPFWEAATSMEHEDDEEKAQTHVRLVSCLLRLNQAAVCERYLSDLSRTNSEWNITLHPYRVEALLKLQQWDTLENELNNHKTVARSWPSDVGHLLLTARSKNVDAFNENMKTAVDHVVEKLSVASRDSGTGDGGYSHMLRLHMLSEIDEGAKRLLMDTGASDHTQLEEMVSEWEQRLKIVQPSMDVLFAVLDLRKQILKLAPPAEPRERAVGACWLEAAKVARKTGHYQSAWSFLVKAKEFPVVETFVEEAKLLWNKDEKVEAISCLKLGLIRNYADLLGNQIDANMSEERRFSFAKAQLLYANYCRESSSIETVDISRVYRHLIHTFPRWEDGHYYAGLHSDQCLHSPSNTTTHTYDAYINVMEFYATSLEYGSRYVHHSMPRLLTLWLDSTQMLYRNYVRPLPGASVTPKQQQQAIDLIHQMNNVISRAFRRIAAYQFYCCFSQLISRICHPCSSTYQVLKDILSGLISQYPRQCIWMAISVKRSSVQERSLRCKEILYQAIEKNPSVEAIFASVDKLTELLIGVCERGVEAGVNTLSLKKDFRPLIEFINRSASSYNEKNQIILPLQMFMDVTFPAPSPGQTPSLDHMPFNEHPVYIHRFLDAVEVFPTMQKPKRISLVGSDGREYAMMCKARDDLRLDKRLMEFTNLLNGCMLRDPEARRRELHIRTYSVTPLSEKCGLLEWVPNLDGLRNIYIRLCNESGRRLPSPGEMLPFKCKASDTLERKLKIFTSDLLPRHPILLKRWFSRSFPDPVVWYKARTNFVRTAAVMSMVGYVLGLGDRHGENILLDRKCGDVVHVDFNCLFNRGESLEVPEVVPFRLTRNMVDAMGPLGYEGPFRRTCEVIIKLMRRDAGMLRTVLETFLHDPLVEWQHGAHGHAGAAGRAGPKPRPESGEDKAKEHLKNIDLRLQGRVKPSLREPYGLPLSVEGQVNVLIQQATETKLLAQMYIGWGPFI